METLDFDMDSHLIKLSVIETINANSWTQSSLIYSILTAKCLPPSSGEAQNSVLL